MGEGVAPRIPSEVARSLVERLDQLEAGIEATRAQIVATMREDGQTWQDVGDAFSVSRQAAHARWNNGH